MKTRITPFIALAILSTAMLTGCSLIPTGPPMIDPDDIADTAEEALEDAYDVTYKVDCGNDDVELTKGENVDCVATDRDTDLEYDADVEITRVKGDRYEVEVELDDQANNADDVDTDTDTDTDTDNNGDAPTVSGDDIAALAVEALTPVLGYEPAEMACLSDEVEIFVDNYEYCYFYDENDDFRTVEVTITSVSGSKYEIDAEVID